MALYRASLRGSRGKAVFFFECSEETFENAKRRSFSRIPKWMVDQYRKNVEIIVRRRFRKLFPSYEGEIYYSSFRYRPATQDEQDEFYGVEKTALPKPDFVGACDKDWCDACRKGDYHKCPNRR